MVTAKYGGRLVQIRPLVLLAVRITTLLILYLLIEAWLMNAASLPEDSYFQPVIFVELIKNIGYLQLIAAAVALAILLRYRPLWLNWSEIEQGKRLRWLILLLAFILAWSYSTYDYNLYFNQAHYVDRFLILLSCVLIYWRPIFVLPFVLSVISVAWQFHYPIGGYSTTEQFQLLQIMILFVAALLIMIVTGRRQTTDFVFVMLTMVAAYYWWPGLGKLRLNWITHGHLFHLLFAAYANGWLGFLAPETVTTIGQIMSRFDLPMMAFTLAVECGALLFLWRRRLMLVLLGGWIMMHLGIVALSGIFFWQWIIRNVGLIFFFGGNKNGYTFPIFTREHFLLSLILIGGSKFWFKPTNLAWYDTRISYTYKIEAHGVSGNIYSLSPLFFSPYYYQFSLGAFGYLTKRPQPVVILGAAWDRPTADVLLEARSPEDVFLIESNMGNRGYDSAKATTFADFLLRFVGNLNDRGSSDTWLSPLQAPPQLLTFPTRNAFEGQEQITKLLVYQVTSLYDGYQLAEIRNDPLLELTLAASESGMQTK